MATANLEELQRLRESAVPTGAETVSTTRESHGRPNSTSGLRPDARQCLMSFVPELVPSRSRWSL